MSGPAAETILDYRVPYADTDQMGVVYYANYLVYFERLRNEILRETGFTYREMEARGLSLPVIEAHVNYRRPARYDDVLTLRGHYEVVSFTRLRVEHEICRAGEVLARGYTIHACMADGRPVRLPAELKTGAPTNGQT